MNSIFFTDNFKKESLKLRKNNWQLRKRFNKQFELFTKDPFHPSLKIHKLKGRRSKQYAIWIDDNLRAIYTKTGNEYIFFEPINHDQY